jgi:hypothetical protein
LVLEIEDLKNYGKPLSESQREIPDEVEKEVKSISTKRIKERLGLLKMILLAFRISKERKRLSREDLSEVRNRGLRDESFISYMINNAAIFSALAKFVGKGEALEIHNEIMDIIAPIVNSHIFPSEEEFRKFDDVLAALREYCVAIFKANEKAGLHSFELVEDAADAFQVNINYCAYYEIPRQLGIPEAALPLCYGDDVFLPPIAEGAGIRFARKGTLARGDKFCDFRFERI